MYEFRKYHIPDYMMPGLERYIEYGVEPGHFLMAILKNDLKGAVGHGDEENVENISAFIGYLHNNAPDSCWGSPENVKKYLSIKSKERNKVIEDGVVSVEQAGQ